MSMIANAIPNLTDEALCILAKDCELRIGSHVAAGDSNPLYVESQRKIIHLVQEELLARKTEHSSSRGW